MRELMIVLGLIVAVSLAGSPSHAAGDPTLVKTQQDSVRGALDGELVVFKGIPYAAPPVGPLRWKATQPPAKRENVLDATKFGPSCPIFDGSKMAQGKWITRGADLFIGIPQAPGTIEDCLHLNIWAPVGAKRAAVMVWIQAGGLPSSFPLFDGAALSRQGVVVVTMNFRHAASARLRRGHTARHS